MAQRFLSVDPLAIEFAAWSTYTYVLDNPITFIDPDGKAPDDVVYYNTSGEEIHRIQSNTRFETHVAFNSAATGADADFLHEVGLSFLVFEQVAMPNVITTRTQSGENVEGSQYQLNDYQIAASTHLTNRDLNSGNLIVADRGGNIIGQSYLEQVDDISPTMVKAWSMQESHAGVTGSILQVNNTGDYSADKASIGIVPGASYSTHQEINLAIRYAIGKGFKVTDVNYSNEGKTVNRTYKWQGWNRALSGYNGGGVRGYSDYIETMIKESKAGTPENY